MNKDRWVPLHRLFLQVFRSKLSLKAEQQQPLSCNYKSTKGPGHLFSFWGQISLVSIENGAGSQFYTTTHISQVKRYNTSTFLVYCSCCAQLSNQTHQAARNFSGSTNVIINPSLAPQLREPSSSKPAQTSDTAKHWTSENGSEMGCGTAQPALWGF